MTVQYGTENMHFSCRITKARIQTHTHRIFNTYFFTTTRMVTRTRMLRHTYTSCPVNVKAGLALTVTTGI